MIIETTNLTKLYGNKVGCQNICLSISEGQVFGFLGPNGAGKSTLIKTLVGLIFPSSGTAKLLGKPLGDLKAKEKIGFLPENFRFQDWLTGYEILAYHSALHKLPASNKAHRINEVLSLVGLKGRENQRVHTFSHGMQQRLGLAVALLPDPDLLFLDEPTSALDPLGRKEVRDLIHSLKARGKTIFLNSHLLSEIEMICDEVAIIKKGAIIASGSVDELNSGKTEVEIKIENLNDSILLGLNAMGLKCTRSEESLLLELVHEKQIPEAVQIIVNNGGLIYKLIPKHQSLENLFIKLISEGGE